MAGGNTINKKHRNLQQRRRQSKHSTKAGSKRTPKDVIIKHNVKLGLAADCHAGHEIAVIDKGITEEDEKLDDLTLLRLNKISGIRSAKLGKFDRAVA